jgi:hypothetical protein
MKTTLKAKTDRQAIKQMEVIEPLSGVNMLISTIER